MVAPAQPTIRILIATPIQNGQVWCETADSLLRIALGYADVQGITWEWERFGGMGVAVARNELVYAMYAKGCHGVLFWDSDIIAKPHDVLGLVRHGKDMVGGLYRHKTDERKTWVANFIPGEVPDKNGLLKVEDCGAGFLFVSRRVFDTIALKGLAKPYTRGFATPKPKGTTMHDFFSMGVINDPLHGNEPTYKTEDFMLAHLARLAGFDCYVDTQVRVDHLGTTKFSGSALGMPEPWKALESDGAVVSKPASA
jgi:hypothetical protein